MPNPLAGEKVLNLGADALKVKSFESEQPVQRTTDPVILPQPYASPGDFAAQYPTPLDPTEIIAMCEEISVYKRIPEEPTQLSAHTWRELNELAFTSGSAYIAFADGECPEEYAHDGDNETVSIKNLGAKKTLSYRDIMHSKAVAGGNWHGINTLVGGIPGSEGLPGGMDSATFEREHVASVKEKEVKLAGTLVINGLDRLIVLGDHAENSLEFTGIEEWAENYSCTWHTNGNSASGTFSAIAFDRFLSEACAIPTVIFGHSTAIQELMSAYYQLGYQGSQIVNHTTGDRITPGYNFGSFVNTAVGRLEVVSDNNFTRTDIGGGNFQGVLYALRMTHNGEPLVYRSTQIPLAFNDLVPGCTAISFEVWTATALIIKACCAQGAYTSQFTGRTGQSVCTAIG